MARARRPLADTAAERWSLPSSDFLPNNHHCVSALDFDTT